MKVITVIPITKGFIKDSLSYFTAKEVEPGAVVLVPLKNKPVPALVIRVEEALALKTTLRSSAFSLKKVERVVTEQFFLPAFLRSINLVAPYFAGSPGPLLKSLVPQAILSALATISAATRKPPLSPPRASEAAAKIIYQDKYVLQEPDKERLAFYKSLIREEFAKKQSVFFCLPTLSDIEQTLAALEKGISEYTVILHPGLGKKQLVAAWQQALDESHPVLVIATPLFLSLPRPDLRTIIVDKENSPSYKTFSRPYIDLRRFAEVLAEELGAKIIFGDMVLRSENIYKSETGELLTLSPLKYRSFSEAEQLIVAPNKGAREGFRAVGQELEKLLREAQAENSRTVIFSHRRGLAPVTLCQDCGLLVRCDHCACPLVLHKKKTGRLDQATKPNLFLCHHCQTAKEVASKCRQCGSWRLAAYGTGLETIVAELKALLPQTTIFTLASDTIKTPKQAKDLVGRFLGTPGSLLVGTEMLLYYLKERVENVVVASLDPLFMLPDFRVKEKIFNLLLRLRLLANKRFVIQTQNPTEPVLGYARQGNLLDFYREELSDRERFLYPPFTTLIKITAEGAKEEVVAAMEKLDSQLADYDPLIFPAFLSTLKDKYRMHALLKLSPEQWSVKKIDNNLLTILKNLPPPCVVDVDPEDIL